MEEEKFEQADDEPAEAEAEEMGEREGEDQPPNIWPAIAGENGDKKQDDSCGEGQDHGTVDQERHESPEDRDQRHNEGRIADEGKKSGSRRMQGSSSLLRSRSGLQIADFAVDPG